jgi:hypothetical protein
LCHSDGKQLFFDQQPFVNKWKPAIYECIRDGFSGITLSMTTDGWQLHTLVFYAFENISVSPTYIFQYRRPSLSAHPFGAWVTSKQISSIRCHKVRLINGWGINYCQIGDFSLLQHDRRQSYNRYNRLKCDGVYNRYAAQKKVMADWLRLTHKSSAYRYTPICFYLSIKYI